MLGSLAREQVETAVVKGRIAPLRLWRGVASLLIVIGIAGGTIGCRENTSGSTAAPPLVTVARPTTQTVTDYLNFTGNTPPTDPVTLVPPLTAYPPNNHFP